ncbi:uncharacterized protein LOC142229273 [Haematobia irritans]|uniref:uncharacterized protein LOC142229273 n=1 Tax=Haematobia irritans TaxID=7368 RepID=UPI003F4FA27B
MSQSMCCCLCIETSNDYRNLYTKDGEKNEEYDLVIKYFSNSILEWNVEDPAVICIDCWTTIEQFFIFQNSVIAVQERKRKRKVDVGNKEYEDEPLTDLADNADGESTEKILQTQKAVTANVIPAKDFRKSSKEDLLVISKNVSDIELALRFYRLENHISLTLNKGINEEGDIEQSIVSSGENLDLDNSSCSKESPEIKQSADMKSFERACKSFDKSLIKWLPQWKCLQCPLLCTSYFLLCQHYREKHPHEMNHILSDQQKNRYRYEIEKHYRRHLASMQEKTKTRQQVYEKYFSENSKAHQCPKCLILFPSSKHSRQHILHKLCKKDDKPQSYTCLVCDKIYRNSKDLRLHNKLIHENNRECEICHEQFYNDKSLLHHLRNHKEFPTYSCDFCPRKFLFLGSLKQHFQEDHPLAWKKCINNTAHFCNLCKRKFNDRLLLKAHLLEMHPTRGLKEIRRLSQYSKMSQSQGLSQNKEEVVPLIEISDTSNSSSDEDIQNNTEAFYKNVRKKRKKKLFDVEANKALNPHELDSCTESLFAGINHQQPTKMTRNQEPRNINDHFDSDDTNRSSDLLADYWKAISARKPKDFSHTRQKDIIKLQSTEDNLCKKSPQSKRSLTGESLAKKPKKDLMLDFSDAGDYTTSSAEPLIDLLNYVDRQITPNESLATRNTMTDISDTNSKDQTFAREASTKAYEKTREPLRKIGKLNSPKRTLSYGKQSYADDKKTSHCQTSESNMDSKDKMFLPLRQQSNENPITAVSPHIDEDTFSVEEELKKLNDWEQEARNIIEVSDRDNVIGKTASQLALKSNQGLRTHISIKDAEETLETNTEELVRDSSANENSREAPSSFGKGILKKLQNQERNNKEIFEIDDHLHKPTESLSDPNIIENLSDNYSEKSLELFNMCISEEFEDCIDRLDDSLSSSVISLDSNKEDDNLQEIIEEVTDHEMNIENGKKTQEITEGNNANLDIECVKKIQKSSETLKRSLNKGFQEINNKTKKIKATLQDPRNSHPQPMMATDIVMDVVDKDHLAKSTDIPELIREFKSEIPLDIDDNWQNRETENSNESITEKIEDIADSHKIVDRKENKEPIKVYENLEDNNTEQYPQNFIVLKNNNSGQEMGQTNESDSEKNPHQVDDMVKSLSNETGNVTQNLEDAEMNLHQVDDMMKNLSNETGNINENFEDSEKIVVTLQESRHFECMDIPKTEKKVDIKKEAPKKLEDQKLQSNSLVSSSRPKQIEVPKVINNSDDIRLKSYVDNPRNIPCEIKTETPLDINDVWDNPEEPIMDDINLRLNCDESENQLVEKQTIVDSVNPANYNEILDKSIKKTLETSFQELNNECHKKLTQKHDVIGFPKTRVIKSGETNSTVSASSPKVNRYLLELFDDTPTSSNREAYYDAEKDRIIITPRNEYKMGDTYHRSSINQNPTDKDVELRSTNISDTNTNIEPQISKDLTASTDFGVDKSHENLSDTESEISVECIEAAIDVINVDDDSSEDKSPKEENPSGEQSYVNSLDISPDAMDEWEDISEECDDENKQSSKLSTSTRSKNKLQRSTKTSSPNKSQKITSKAKSSSGRKLPYDRQRIKLICGTKKYNRNK